jgi:hypothetical protein
MGDKKDSSFSSILFTLVLYFTILEEAEEEDVYNHHYDSPHPAIMSGGEVSMGLVLHSILAQKHSLFFCDIHESVYFTYMYSR